MKPIFAPTSVEIGELRADPTAVLESAGDRPIAVLDEQRPIGYLLSASAWQKICDLLEDAEILEIVDDRLSDGQAPIKVSLDDL
jgi:antitoxin StbD